MTLLYWCWHCVGPYAPFLFRSGVKRYLHWIGAERLYLMGYESNDFLNTLDETPGSASHLGSDALRMAYGGVYRLFEPHISKRQLAFAMQGHKVHAHT